ncbi:hypothetical protein [Ralstonia pseudosolanacearum]|uniref:hypothetical protein n=1 Tax=Ralstonia pseudosolanacearum TaxID=1310165 RepID=UPI003CE6C976
MYASKSLAVVLLMMTGIAGVAEAAPLAEFVCSGQVRFGEETIKDKLVLRLDGDAMEIKGMPGTLSTFDGTAYKICSESRDEIMFGYPSAVECGGHKVTRSGGLQKVTGDMKIQRLDMGKPFTGSYKCQSANRLVD